MKFVQLIEYNMRNNFPEKWYTKCSRETTARSFSKKSKFSITLYQYSIVLYIFFYCLPGWGLSKKIETKLQTTWFYLIQSFTSKSKKRSGASLPASFSAWFLKKNISVAIFYNLTKFQYLVAFTSWDI